MDLAKKPTSFLCPYCGEWHPWYSDRPLNYHTSKDTAATHMCHKSYRGKTSFYFDNKFCYYETEGVCKRAKMDIKGKTPLASIIQEGTEPRFTFKHSFESYDLVGSHGCDKTCPKFFRVACQLPELGDESNHINMVIQFGFNFSDEIAPSISEAEQQTIENICLS